ncbi:ABC transporter family substrate-binding protein [Arthrobacter cupressi]|uniref:Peptide/nickel transport system substrate-binding protein n=1 Tax=Arthrobacter cupressi TaxID=1045773 RepID=A0A1G8PFP5_9MICC|nr:ABC transporter family substrate-binding protein [Arthrobacter cupressi]NYD76822.1 peptide/nickel transport system substrate-binding protein [Arthrobacter cupressi]SDI91146.1 peptide/nickel transport system substrate-binding protein [Arthrobacter cupressi]
MRFGRISKAVGVMAIATLALSACAGNTGSPSTTTGGAQEGGTIGVAETNGFSSFNSGTADGNSDVNGHIGYATHSNFLYIDDKLNIVKNEKFGKYEKLSDDPLTVKYTVNEGVKWSDGTQVSAADLLLTWASGSAYYDDANPEKKTGTTYFLTAADTSGLNLTDFPEVGSDNRSITLKYSKPFADWELALGFAGNGGIDIPAHVVAQKAGLKDAQALVDLFKSVPRGDAAAPKPVNAQLKKVADFWSTGFDSKTLPSDPSLFLSNGPYVVKDVVAEQSLTLVRNKDYNWGPTPHADEIVVRTIGSAPAQVQALKNGEVDIINPQASADTVDQIKALDGVELLQGKQLSYDHLDLNYSGPFADKDVRTAFMLTVPRKDIVDKIIKKIDPEATPLDSQIFVPAQAAYADSVKNNGSSAYQEVDIDKAKQLLAGKTPTIRIMYNKDNPNRVDAFSLIRESATKAGFKIVDGGLGKADWSAHLGDGSYDATIFGWINSGVGVTGTPQIFKTAGGSNFNGLSDPEADKLMDELIVTTDKAKQDELQTKIDAAIWSTSYGLPLFQSPDVKAYSDQITGVTAMPNQTGVWWNVWDWARK